MAVNLSDKRRLSLMAIYVMVGSFVIVNAESPSQYNCSKSVDQLVDIIAELQKDLSIERAKNGNGPSSAETKGTTYVRWGRTTCEGNATVVYSGYASGPVYDVGGSGGNFLCLPEDPEWRTFIDGYQPRAGLLAGVEYELFNSGSFRNNIFSESNNDGNPLLDNPAPCAVCYSGGRSSVLMVPAKTQCPQGWMAEYSGYLVSEHSANARQRSSYICWDEAPETAAGSLRQNPSLIYPVEVRCGTLPCSVYISGRELTCIVCSK